MMKWRWNDLRNACSRSPTPGCGQSDRNAVDTSFRSVLRAAVQDSFDRPGMRNVFALLSFLSVVILPAQDTTLTRPSLLPRNAKPMHAAVDTPRVTTTGDVVIHQDERITKLMEQYVAHKHAIKGYRVQIFLGSEREKARDMRRTFLLKHPDVGGYESYLAPNFRIRVGDLRTRLEAEKLRHELKTEFPGCYIVPDEIELPRLPEVR